MARKYKSASKAEKSMFPSGTTQLPVDRPVAVYYRQSTQGQVGNISTSMQTIDMALYLQQRGWDEKSVRLIDMDAGVSGTKRIDERPGMRSLFQMIDNQEIGAVACQDEDRLFRDVTQIQVNIFIQACKQANVLVLTPSMVYDFAHPQLGVHHARQFRFKSEVAAEYLNGRVKNMADAKERMAQDGMWVGGQISVGYMVDVRKSLPNGSRNPGWMRYVPFPPFAEVILQYFLLFLQFNGNMNATIRHIHEHGPFLPDPITCRPPEGFKVKYKIKRSVNGLHPTRSGLRDALQNAAYIGHWIHGGVVTRQNNHEAIVPIDIFSRVFNYLSSIAFDGSENFDFRPIKQYSRKSDSLRPVERPLCAGLITEKVGSKWANVNVSWYGDEKRYRYEMIDARPVIAKRIWARSAEYIDDLIVKLVKNKIAITFDPQEWDKRVEEMAAEHQDRKRQVTSQRTALEQVMQGQIASLGVLMNTEMIRAVEVDYERHQAEHEHLNKTLADIELKIRNLDTAYALRDRAGEVFGNWDKATRDDKISLIHGCIARIEAVHTDNTLRFVVYWLDNTSEGFTVARRSKPSWSKDEVRRLIELADRPQVEIAAVFPNRTWASIRNRLMRANGQMLYFNPLVIGYGETYEEYLVRIHTDDLDAGCSRNVKLPSMYTGSPLNLAAMILASRV